MVTRCHPILDGAKLSVLGQTTERPFEYLQWCARRRLFPELAPRHSLAQWVFLLKRLQRSQYLLRNLLSRLRRQEQQRFFRDPKDTFVLQQRLDQLREGGGDDTEPSSQLRAPETTLARFGHE